MKPQSRCRPPQSAVVTPRAGVWIETFMGFLNLLSYPVTPRAGVWIETIRAGKANAVAASLPVRECGLKPYISVAALFKAGVTPRAGVWIETLVNIVAAAACCRHSPCGSVD